MNNEENFWQGEFGNNYTARNVNLVENNYQMFSHIFNRFQLKLLDNGNGFCAIKSYPLDINSIIEFGAGSGMNIQALQRIFPDAQFTAIEINESAIKSLSKISFNSDYRYNVAIKQESILNFKEFNAADLVLSKGLLIHIHPDNIQKAYDVLYNASNKYIMLCEYYNPVPIDVMYRDNRNKLWKRPFAEEMMQKYSDLKLVDYGFVSKLDKYPQDDITWFLLQK